MFELIDAYTSDAGMIAGFAIAYIVLPNLPDARRLCLDKYRRWRRLRDGT